MSRGDKAARGAQRGIRSDAIRASLVEKIGRNSGLAQELSSAGIVQPERMLLALTARAWVARAREGSVSRGVESWIEEDVGWAVSLEPIRRFWRTCRKGTERIFLQVSLLPAPIGCGDVLGALHHDLFGAELRHALGEHYTPAWLCERVLSKMGTSRSGVLIDPACGSGAFLLAALRLRMEAESKQDAAALAADLIGVDRSDLSIDLTRAALWSELAPRCGIQSPLPDLRLSVGDGLDGPPSGQKVRWVAGNPPWLTLSDVQPTGAQSVLLAWAGSLDLLPEGRRDRPHLDLAAVFFAQARSWLVPEGEIGMVLPRSIMTASQHEPLRASGRIRALWDLEGVRPLFPVPACVAFGTGERAEAPISGESLSGSPRGFASRTTRWHLARMGEQTAFSEEPLKISGVGHYRSRFRQGASLVPGVCWFVEQEDAGWRSASWARHVAKRPWRMKALRGPIEGRFVFLTARGRNIVPFGTAGLVQAFMPFEEGRVLDSRALALVGAPGASAWMAQAEELWIAHRTPRSASMTLVDRLDYQRGLSGQHPGSRWSVLFAASAKDANAVCLDCAELSAPFVADTTTYRFQTDSEDEAHFLAAVINADLANRRIKVFQARGLFGPRHVHKRILDAVPVGRFDPKRSDHVALSDLGRACSEQVRVKLQGQEGELSPQALGRLRSEIRSELAPLRTKIDQALVAALD